MKPFFVLLLALMCMAVVRAQDCNCTKDFEFVVNYYEENLPGFADNVTPQNRAEYEQFKDTLRTVTYNYCNNEDLCFKTLLVYVAYFEDNHSSIYPKTSTYINENKKKQVKQFLNSEQFKNRERVDSLPEQVTQPLESIENVYQTKDASYTVAIIPSKNEFRDYVAVITDSKTPLWQKGQVKFELKQLTDSTFDMFMYMRDHSLRYTKKVKLVNGVLNDYWFNTALEQKVSYNVEIGYSTPTFKEIDAQTNYLYVPTFNGNRYDELAQFYAQHDSVIKAKPHLIIDVRNNGGGSDACAWPLLQYLYTQPFIDDTVAWYATKENIRKCTEWLAQMKQDTLNFDAEFLVGFEAEIEVMKAAPNKTFIPRSTGDTIALDTVLPYPEKVIVVANKNCASSCETLLFWALESDKTILVGENSGGYVGYGEISIVPTPNFNFELGCTMTRYAQQRKYEANGIPPQVYLTNDTDWVQQAMEMLYR